MKLRPGQRIKIKQAWYDLCPIEGVITGDENDDPNSGYGEMDFVCVRLENGSTWSTLAQNLVKEGFYYEVKVFEGNS